MKRILVVLFVALFSGACSSSVRNADEPQTKSQERGTCDSGDETADLACMRAQLKSANQSLEQATSRLNELDRKSETPDENSPPVFMRPSSRPMQMRRIVAPRTTRGDCINGYNLSVKNMTEHFLAVSSAALSPCGQSNLVQQWVEYPNGEPDLIWLIPPRSTGGNVGNYYFDPALGGDGRQDYTVTAYSQSSVSGMRADHPRRATGKMFVGRVVTPWERGSWANPKIFPSDLN